MIAVYEPLSIYSIFIALFWSGIFIFIISLLIKNNFLSERFSTYTLFALTAACTTRILLPLELPFTYTFDSRKILPAIQSFLNIPLIQFSYITVKIGLIIVLLWICPALLIIYRRIKEYFYFKRALDIMPASKDQRLYKIFAMADVHNKLTSIKIIVHASVQSPAITGLFRPVIILPDINFNDNELLGIFIHEISHYKFKHNFIKMLVEFTRAAFWWNPLFKIFSSELSHVMELQADKYVCRNLTHSQIAAYLKGITKVIANTSKKNITPPCSCSILEEDNNEKIIQRFKIITENRYQNKTKLDLIAVPLIIALFLFSYSFVIFPFSEPTYEDMTGSSNTSINEYKTEYSEEYFLIKAGDRYDLYSSSGKFIANINPNDLPYIEPIKIYESKEEAEKERRIK